MNPNNQAYYSSTSDPNKKKRLILIVGLVVLITGAVAYLIFGGNDGGGSENNGGQVSNEEVKLSLASLESPDFVAPDMKGYIKRSDFTIDVGDYTTTDNSCNIQFGVVPAVELPGLTVEEIATTHLGATEQAGAIGAEPQEGDDLVLSASEGKATYTLPTLDFAYERDNVNYKASYSVVILKENERAYIRRYCANADGAVSGQDFRKINDKAKQIKVRAE